jgi:hypothetical protein
VCCTLNFQQWGVLKVLCSVTSRNVFWFYSIIKATLRRPRYPSGYCELLVQTSKFKFINNKPFTVEATKLPFRITRFMINQVIKIRDRCFMSAIPVTISEFPPMNFTFGLLFFLRFCLHLFSFRTLGIKIPSEVLFISPKHRTVHARTKQNITLNWLHNWLHKFLKVLHDVQIFKALFVKNILVCCDTAQPYL